MKRNQLLTLIILSSIGLQAQNENIISPSVNEKNVGGRILSVELQDTYYRPKDLKTRAVSIRDNNQETIDATFTPYQKGISVFMGKRSKKRPGLEYHVGLSFITITKGSHLNTVFFDTDSQENRNAYIDLHENRNALSISNKLIYQVDRNPKHRVKVYMGLGASLGYVYSAESDRMIFHEFDNEFFSGRRLDSFTNNSEKKGVQASINATLGISATLSKKDNFLGRSKVYYEFNPRLQVVNFSDNNGFNLANLSGAFGYAYEFKKKKSA